MAKKPSSSRRSIRQRAKKAIAPLVPAAGDAGRTLAFMLAARRTRAGRDLPPQHLVFFLLVELLRFTDLGPWEKTAWTVPVAINGRTYTVEYRKFGLGVFGPDSSNAEEDARQIVDCVRRGVMAARPFFAEKARVAVEGSALNIRNRCAPLHDRYEFFKRQYRQKLRSAARRDRWKVVQKGSTMIGTNPSYRLRGEAGHIAKAAIEAFFSFTEHMFVHLAVLRSRVGTGPEVAALMEAEWSEKFKAALDITEPETKRHFDRLLVVRRQIRNFVAHGRSGRTGEHSSITLPQAPRRCSFPEIPPRRDLGSCQTISDDDALKIADDFLAHIWSGPLRPAKIYLLTSPLPTILPHARDGVYAAAMSSARSMAKLVDRLGSAFDRAANMD
jgi:hypothetical protein